MIQTISVSDFQKSTKNAFANEGVTWVLKNNKIHGGVFNHKFAQFINEENITDLFEDWLLMQDKNIQQASAENALNLQKKDFRQYETFDQVFL